MPTRPAPRRWYGVLRLEQAPRYPDGLSVDGAGNLFVASSASGNTKPAQLWVFPTDPLLPAGAGFLAPRLIDSSFGGLSVQTLEETVVARTTS